MASDSPEKKIILLTRPMSEAQEMARALVQQQYKVLVDPLLQIRPIDCDFLVLSEVQALIATSMNGIRRLSQLTSNREIPLYVVGDVSAAEAHKMGFKHVYGAQGSVESLIEKIENKLHPQGGKIIYLSGREIKGDMVQILSLQGFQIKRIIVYEALAADTLQPETKEALITGRLKAVLFFSPRTVEIFATLSFMYAQAFKDIIAVCMSPEVAAPLTKYQWQKIVIAPERSGRSMMSTLASCFDE